MKRPININTYNFECCVIESEIPVLLVFGAFWDHISNKLFSQLDYWAEKYQDKILFGKVEYENNQLIFHNCEIKDIPCMVLFENGKIIKTVVKTDFSKIGSVGDLIDWYYGIYPYY